MSHGAAKREEAVMRKVVDIFIRVLEIVTATFFVLMLLAVTLQIAARNLLSVPVRWTEELARFLYVWVTFIGAVIITRDNDHIRIDYLGQAVGPKARNVLNIIAEALAIIYTLAVLRGGILLVSINGGMPLASMPNLLTFAQLYLAVPVGMGLVLLFLLADLVRNVGRLFRKADASPDDGHDRTGAS